MTEFSFRELECFLAVAEELSFTRAANRLRLAQPPLSRHIRNLEDKLGVRLFDRNQRQVQLTEAGKAFRAEAREIFLKVRMAGEAARRAGQGETGRLEVGFVSAILSSELVRVFTDFRNRHEEVQLNLHDKLPAAQIEALQQGELDIGFVGILPEKEIKGLRFVSWMEESLRVYLPPNHPLTQQQEVRVKDLRDEPFIVISAEAAPAYNAFIETLCEREGFRPRVVQETQRAQAVAAMTVAGAGIAILPDSLNRVTGNGFPLVGARRKPVCMAHAVGYRSDLSETAAMFIESLGREG